jgi:hypothetical protein
VQLRKFDTQEQRSHPVDVTGSKIEFSIYAPQYSVDVTVTPSAGAPPVTFSLELTNEQSAAYHVLKTESERTEFVRALAIERRVELQSKLSNALKERSSKPIANS